MDKINGEQPAGNGAEEAAEGSQASESTEQETKDESNDVRSQIREFFHSQFGGISNIWPSSVCGH
ncbi:hypothetical protein [Arthrobacter sp. M4]|uniref:hypothetical protein n=1 Tax=Arthrobacter sp. M4 TaxID=218160 RepID=UPI001CDB6851|nr:hypothetical protein [Arthrobacter sp. M4]MCA4133467.1 hypothetical protein [Arthrobacter sp. M4]